MGLDVQGSSLSLLALYQHQMGESGSYPSKTGGPTLGLVSHYKDILFLPSPLPYASEVGPCSAAQIPSTTVHSCLWERGLWMGDFPEQRHGAQNVPGGSGGAPWVDWLFGLQFQAASDRLRPLILVEVENLDGLRDICHMSG